MLWVERFLRNSAAANYLSPWEFFFFFLMVEGRRNNIVCVCENSYIFFPKDIQVLRGELITFIKEIETFFWEAEQMPQNTDVEERVYIAGGKNLRCGQSVLTFWCAPRAHRNTQQGSRSDVISFSQMRKRLWEFNLTKATWVANGGAWKNGSLSPKLLHFPLYHLAS